VKRATDCDRQTFAAGHREAFAPLMSWSHRGDLPLSFFETDGK
jgi:hypothetical protein